MASIWNALTYLSSYPSLTLHSQTSELSFSLSLILFPPLSLPLSLPLSFSRSLSLPHFSLSLSLSLSSTCFNTMDITLYLVRCPFGKPEAAFYLSVSNFYSSYTLGQKTTNIVFFMKVFNVTFEE